MLVLPFYFRKKKNIYIMSKVKFDNIQLAQGFIDTRFNLIENPSWYWSICIIFNYYSIGVEYR